MLKSLDTWMWRFIITVIVGSVVSAIAVYNRHDAMLQLGRVTTSVGGLAMYACYVADRFFGEQGAKMVQGVFLACLLFLILISGARLLGGTISTDLVFLQLIGFSGLTMLFGIAILGFSGLMASNYMRVRSGRMRALREIITAVIICCMPLSGFIGVSNETAPLLLALAGVVLQSIGD